MNFIELTLQLENNLGRDNIVLVYAFNATGKTRLSKYLSEKYMEDDDKIRVLCFNAFLEDDFIWDNEKLIFKYSLSPITKYIYDEGLFDQIIDNFKRTVGMKIEPKFDAENRIIEFIIPDNDDNDNKIIKISKGEETIFKWVLFLTVVESVITLLKDKKKDRSTDIFDDLRYIIIDDPISSIDDYRVYTIACQIISLARSMRENISNKSDEVNISLLVTTHHILFYNILFNNFRRKNNCGFFILKKEKEQFIFDKKPDNMSFLAYHFAVINEINDDIMKNNLQKKHFNLFRSILEKTTIFLGYDNWTDLFTKRNYFDYERIKRVLNCNSHGNNPEIEISELDEEQKEVYIAAFNWFLKEYHFFLKD